MYGTHINTLNVYTKTAGQLGTPVWSHTGEWELGSGVTQVSRTVIWGHIGEQKCTDVTVNFENSVCYNCI
jgi:hypothetical protein